VYIESLVGLGLPILPAVHFSCSRCRIFIVLQALRQALRCLRGIFGRRERSEHFGLLAQSNELIGQTRDAAVEPSRATKEKVREYMERRQVERRQGNLKPPHDPEQVRKEVGWDGRDRREGERRR
jgi:hypothetical protein